MIKTSFPRRLIAVALTVIFGLSLLFGFISFRQQVARLAVNLQPFFMKQPAIIRNPLPATIVSLSPNDQREPTHDDAHVVWSEKINDYWQIILFDIASAARLQLTTDPFDHVGPLISGDWVLWQQGEPGNPTQIAGVNLVSGQSLDFPVEQVSQPSLDGSNFVWLGEVVDISAFTIPLHHLDLESQMTLTLAQARGLSSPSISGNIIVWEDWRNQINGHYTADVYGYDLAKQQEFPITTALGNQETPSVSGRYIVWRDNRNTNTLDVYDIYGYDLNTKEEFYIARAGRALALKVRGDYVVWNTIAAIYAYDLKGQILLTVAENTDRYVNQEPSVFNRTIVWTQFDGADRYSAHSQIVMAEIPTQP